MGIVSRHRAALGLAAKAIEKLAEEFHVAGCVGLVEHVRLLWLLRAARHGAACDGYGRASARLAAWNSRRDGLVRRGGCRKFHTAVA